MERQSDADTTCYFDIETTNLTANYGIMLCAVVKSQYGKPRVFRLDEHRNGIRSEDKRLVRAVIEELGKYQYLVSYNGIRFDTKFINTRALYHRLTPLGEKLHIDLLNVARRVLRTNNRRLDTVVNFLEVEEKKTAIDPKYWRWAMLGDSRAMDEVVKHCVQDVLALECVHQRLAPYIKTVRRQ